MTMPLGWMLQVAKEASRPAQVNPAGRRRAGGDQLGTSPAVQHTPSAAGGGTWGWKEEEEYLWTGTLCGLQPGPWHANGLGALGMKCHSELLAALADRYQNISSIALRKGEGARRWLQ